MRLKVLPLERWMLDDITPSFDFSDDELGSDKYPEIRPVFYRNGIYLQDNHCWIEVLGRAFTYEVTSFKFSLALLESQRYNHRQISAIRQICEQRLATKTTATFVILH